MAGLGCGPGVGELVAVGGPATEEASFDGGLCGHGGADPSLDPVAFALAHPAVEAHHDFVGIGAGIDGATHLWHPQLDAVVDEHGEGEAELVAVERPLRLADHDRIEVAIGVPECLEELGRLGSSRPRQGP